MVLDIIAYVLLGLSIMCGVANYIELRTKKSTIESSSITSGTIFHVVTGVLGIILLII